MSDPNVFKRFATERFKRIKYRTTPLFDAAVLLSIAISGAIGLLTSGATLAFSALYTYFFIPQTLAVLSGKAINNLLNERKQTKAWVMLATITASLVLGGLLGYFVLSQSALFVDFACVGGLSPTLIAGLVLAFDFFNDLTEDTNLALLPYLLFFICFLVPVSSMPLMVDVVFVSATSFAFIASLIAKQGMRAYHYFNYGHSNADGYEKNRSDAEQEEYMRNQAQYFNVSEENFTALVNHCEHEINSAKAGERYTLFTRRLDIKDEEVVHSFKDIYFALMKSNPDKTEVINLLNSSKQTTICPNFINTTHLFRTKITHGELSRNKKARQQDVGLRTEDFHQPNIYPGISDSLIEPFTNPRR